MPVGKSCGGRPAGYELLRRYCTLVYAQTRSYQETGRRLGLRRTVKYKLDPELLRRLDADGESRITRP